MREFKVRCSKIGNLMSGSIGLTEKQLQTYNTLIEKDKITSNQTETLNSLIEKKKNLELPTGAKTYIKDWLKSRSDFYSRTKHFQNKYTLKGNANEEESAELISRFCGLGMLFLNNEHFQDEFKTGTPDIILNDEIIDIKNSWDHHTFPLFETELPNSDYYAQMQGYMSLTNKSKARVIYTLTDTPDFLIEREAYYFCRENNIELDNKIYEDFKSRMTFSDIDDSLRVKIFEVERDDVYIKEIETRVLLAREYIKELISYHEKNNK